MPRNLKAKDGRKYVARILGNTKHGNMGRGRFLLKDRRLSGFKDAADHFDTYDEAEAFVEKLKTHPIVGLYALDVAAVDNAKHNPMPKTVGHWAGSKRPFPSKEGEQAVS